MIFLIKCCAYKNIWNTLFKVCYALPQIMISFTHANLFCFNCQHSWHWKKKLPALRIMSAESRIQFWEKKASEIYTSYRTYFLHLERVKNCPLIVFSCSSITKLYMFCNFYESFFRALTFVIKEFEDLVKNTRSQVRKISR